MGTENWTKTKVNSIGRVCTKCNEYKTWDRYSILKGSKTGYHSCCKDCVNAAYRSKVKGPRLEKTYGITLDQFYNMAKEGCAICGKKTVGLNAHVDHCHSTGKVRGVLCYNCNVGLGNFKDDPSLLKKAISYLTNTILSDILVV